MTAESLRQNPDYRLLLALRHEEVMPFIFDQLNGKTRTMRLFLVICLSIAASMLALAIHDVQNGQTGLLDLLKYAGLGTLLVFTIFIPIHEGIHGLAYRLVGAPSVSYGVNWHMLYFYAVADQFVISRKAFVLVALAPFIVIAVFAIVTVFIAPVHIKWGAFGILLMHTCACIGDFAILSYYELNLKYPEMLAYDDAREKISYFFVKEI